MMLNKRWFVFLLTLVMGVGVPALFGSAYAVAGNNGWSTWLFAAGFVGLPLLVWPGYELWLTMWARKDLAGRWFLPVLFPLLIIATSWMWLGGWWEIAAWIYGAILILSVIIMLVVPKEQNEA